MVWCESKKNMTEIQKESKLITEEKNKIQGRSPRPVPPRRQCGRIPGPGRPRGATWNSKIVYKSGECPAPKFPRPSRRVGSPCPWSAASPDRAGLCPTRRKNFELEKNQSSEKVKFLGGTACRAVRAGEFRSRPTASAVPSRKSLSPGRGGRARPGIFRILN